MVKTIVVLGASYAGLAVAHRLLKHTRQREKDIKVVLVSKVRELGAVNTLPHIRGGGLHGTNKPAKACRGKLPAAILRVH